MLNVKKLILDACFDNDALEELVDKSSERIFTDPTYLSRFLAEDEVIETGADLSKISDALGIFLAQKPNISNEEIKTVYLALKNREKNPRGYFDSAGRFYVEDSDLIDVRAPSAKYPYSQMNAARTSKFVKALARKYRVQSIAELSSVAFSE